jgi:hypothetical protein
MQIPRPKLRDGISLGCESPRDDVRIKNDVKGKNKTCGKDLTFGERELQKCETYARGS